MLIRKKLRIETTQITAVAIDELKKALSTCDITRDGGGIKPEGGLLQTAERREEGEPGT